MPVFDITVASFSKFVEWYSTIDGIYLQALKLWKSVSLHSGVAVFPHFSAYSVHLIRQTKEVECGHASIVHTEHCFVLLVQIKCTFLGKC